MEKNNHTILQKHQLKITSSRLKMIELFEQVKKPYSAADVLSFLKREGEKTDRATVYRNLKIFVEKKILKEVDLRGEGKFYELKSLPHHHHLICQSCSSISPFHGCETQKMQKKIEKDGFKIISHSLEFFGICKKCQ